MSKQTETGFQTVQKFGSSELHMALKPEPRLCEIGMCRCLANTEEVLLADHRIRTGSRLDLQDHDVSAGFTRPVMNCLCINICRLWSLSSCMLLRSNT